MISIQNKCRQVLHNYKRHTQNMHQYKDDFFNKLKRELGDTYKTNMQEILTVLQEAYNRRSPGGVNLMWMGLSWCIGSLCRGRRTHD